MTIFSIRSLLIAVFTLCLVLAPVLASHVSAPSAGIAEAFHCGGTQAGHPGDSSFPCDGSAGTGGGGGGGSGGLTNPLKFGSITAFLLAIIDVLLILAVPVIIFFIIYAGYLFVTAQGNEAKLTTARSAFTWAVVGGVIVLGAKIIIEVIQSTVAGFQ